MNNYNHLLNKLRVKKDFIMCKEDPSYFVEKCVHIDHPSKGPIPFAMYDYQREMIKTFEENKYIVMNSARQTGSTITSLSYIFTYAVKNSDRNIMIFVPRNEEHRDVIERIELMADNVPKGMTDVVKLPRQTKHDIHFSNGTRIMVRTANACAGRGMTLDVIYFEGFDRVDHKMQEEIYYSILPCIVTSGNGKMIINMCGGSGLGREIFEDALEGKNHFVPLHIRWDMPPGRDMKWKREMIKITGKEEWDTWYECK